MTRGAPETTDRDEILEWAAQLIEEAPITDIAGIWARRKRAREDAELRAKTYAEARREMASRIRAFKNRPELDALSTLRDLADLPDAENHVIHLRDAWPLAWKGWLNIECIVTCNSNSIPPATRYLISLTERGRQALAQGIVTGTDETRSGSGERSEVEPGRSQSGAP